MSIPEEQLVPYHATELLGERLLVIAPHPDDEVIGCGGLLALHALHHRQARVVIVTDGAAARGTEDAGDYRIRREEESRRGLDRIGIGEPIFLRLPDRGTGDNLELGELLLAQIRDYRPDLIVLPSPVEVHPDHAAVARAVIEALQQRNDLEGELALTRLAFCEVSQPFRPNVLVDITQVADLKSEAIREHASQLEIRDYSAFARGLNDYRAMTLPAAVRQAEAYWVIDLQGLRTTPLSALESGMSPRSGIEISRETLPVSVIIRTRNRLPWLREAVASVVATRYPVKIIVVNDGGLSPRDQLDGDQVQLVEHGESRGRSEAMNSGVAAATYPWLAFLDDDDLFYPEHLDTLSRAASSTGHTAFYTDAVSASLSVGEDGLYRETSRARNFSSDFDRDLLAIDNYIPLPTLLVRRDDFLAAGGFDPAFDLFEDWDFLLRLVRRGSFLHIPRVTCEVRHFSGGDSALLAYPEGSAPFTAARMQIWKRHLPDDSLPLFSRVFEQRKKRELDTFRELVQERGRRSHVELDIMRLERDKLTLLDELVERHRLHSFDVEQRDEVIRKLEQIAAERDRLLSETVEISRLATERGDQLQTALSERDGTLGSVYAEISRLNGILDSIYASRSWKLHELVQRLRGTNA